MWISRMVNSLCDLGQLPPCSGPCPHWQWEALGFLRARECYYLKFPSKFLMKNPTLERLWQQRATASPAKCLHSCVTWERPHPPTPAIRMKMTTFVKGCSRDVSPTRWSEKRRWECVCVIKALEVKLAEGSKQDRVGEGGKWTLICESTVGWEGRGRSGGLCDSCVVKRGALGTWSICRGSSCASFPAPQVDISGAFQLCWEMGRRQSLVSPSPSSWILPFSKEDTGYITRWLGRFVPNPQLCWERLPLHPPLSVFLLPFALPLVTPSTSSRP